MKKKFTYTFVFLLPLAMAVSCVPTDDENSDNSDNSSINRWVYDNLYDYYFWYNEIGDRVIPSQQDPEDYFYSLLYTTEDHWSYITDDYESLSAELDGEPTSMGYSPAFGLISGTSDVFMVIEYVYANSPAYNAGLKRGDIVLKINGEQLTEDNYIDLFYNAQQVLTLGEYSDGGLSYTNKQLSMTATTLKVNPVVFDTVFQINNVKTGYCVITEFISDTEFNKHIDETFNTFKNNSISKLIIDLRYNGGGYMTSAQWLASSIVKSSVVDNKEILTYLTYSDKIGALMSTDELEIRYTTPNVNLNLDEVYFLTASGTASSSELVIIGLQPYINVVTVGENSYGKYTGMWLIPDYNHPPQHNYAMMPIVMKYANANGYTDFTNGITPNYPVEDNIMEAVSFGDVVDPVLSQALTLTNGLLAKKATPSTNPSFKRLKLPKKELRNNLFISKK